MSCKRGHWDRANLKRSAGEKAAADIRKMEAMHAQAGFANNEADVKWLTSLLDHPGIKLSHEPEKMEGQMLRSIEWLAEHPDKGLNDFFRKAFEQRYRLFQYLVTRQEQGLPIEPFDSSKRSQSAAGWRLGSLARIAARERADERKKVMPAWIDDPSKLPKRPPASPKPEE